MAEKKTWEQMTKGEKFIGMVGVSIVLLLAIIVISSFASAFSSTTPSKAEEVSEPAPKPAPVTSYKEVEETEAIAFKKKTRDDSSREVGTSAVTTVGVEGIRTKTFKVTYVDGKETERVEIKNEVTKKPINEVTSIGTKVPYVAPVPTPAPRAQSNCDPNYTGCVPIASDVDCAGGSGNGPAYTGTVRVIGSDIYDLDRDGNGLACE